MFAVVVCSLITLAIISVEKTAIYWIFDNAGFAAGMTVCIFGMIACYKIAKIIDARDAAARFQEHLQEPLDLSRSDYQIHSPDCQTDADEPEH